MFVQVKLCDPITNPLSLPVLPRPPPKVVGASFSSTCRHASRLFLRDLNVDLMKVVTLIFTKTLPSKAFISSIGPFLNLESGPVRRV